MFIIYFVVINIKDRIRQEESSVGTNKVIAKVIIILLRIYKFTYNNFISKNYFVNNNPRLTRRGFSLQPTRLITCLLYTSDAADE